MRKKYILMNILLLALLNSTSLFAEVYKHVDEQGNVTYSDVPQHKGDQPISVPEPMTYKPPSIPKSVSHKKPPIPKGVKYDSVTITQPGNDEAIRSNSGDITVQIASTPALQGTSRYVLFLDGSKVQESAAASVTLTNLNRGSHTISVEIQDDQSQILASSSPVTFHVLRQSVIHP